MKNLSIEKEINDMEMIHGKQKELYTLIKL